MITGIGTPSNHSRIPRPIFASSSICLRGENAKGRLGFRSRMAHHASGIADGSNPTRDENLCWIYQWPVFGIDVQGSAGAFGSPFCNSSIECRSGERIKAMLPSRGGRLMVIPIFMRRSQVA